MIKISNRKIVLSETVLCPESETIKFEVDLPGEETPWKIELAFVEDKIDEKSKEKPKTNMSWSVENDIWTFEFRNFYSSLGHTVSSPLAVGTTTGGLEITILADIAKLTTLYRINFQIMVEESENA